MTADSSYAQNAGAVPPGGWPPPRVAAEADRRQLGNYLGHRRVPKRGLKIRLIIDLSAVVGLLVLVVVLATVNQSIGIEDRIESQISGGGTPALLQAIGLGACFGAIAAIGDTFWTLIGLSRTETFYLYQGGLIQRTGGTVAGLAWSELTEVHPVTAAGNAERPVSYRLITLTQLMDLPVKYSQGGDQFADQVIALIRQHNIAIGEPE